MGDLGSAASRESGLRVRIDDGDEPSASSFGLVGDPCASVRCVPLEAKDDRFPVIAPPVAPAKPVQSPDDIGRSGKRIRCPHCQWEPKSSDRWCCRCGHLWNTFDTRGKCPKCFFQWQTTKCLVCKKWSEHGRWYVGAGPDAAQ